MFDRFNSDDNTEEQEEEVSEDDEEELPEPPEVHMERDETVTFEYTEHEVEVGFTTGDTRTFVFDKMEETTDAYVLSDYQDISAACGSAREIGPNRTKKVTTLVKSNMTFMDTVRRTEKEVSEDLHEEWDGVVLPVAKWYIENRESYTVDLSDIDDETLEEWPAKRAWP